ncbi:unnamed protein product [Coregonus sp. 'balchen']|nr:unnamed protein product [Coregonus sp. 'balchen']
MNASQVDFRYKNTLDGCEYYDTYSCYSGNCRYSTRNLRVPIDSSTNGRSWRNTWCEQETVMTRNVPSDRPFQLSQDSCCWISTVNSMGSWRLLTQVDLGTRSDTGGPNRSPVTGVLPFIRVPQNCQRSYNLMAFDPDGDRVRCRYGVARDTECDMCTQPSGFSMDEGSCTLQYGNTSMAGVYGFELVVEDFPNQHITLSYTDGSRSSRAPFYAGRHRHHGVPPPPQEACIPPLLPSANSLYNSHFWPTPRNGEHLNAEVNKELEIRVKAQATHSTITDVIISGPQNITNHMTTQGEFVIRKIWESISPFASLLKEQTVKAKVVCQETTMTVEVEKSSIPGVNEGHLRLSDPSNSACDLQRLSNSTHIIGVIPLNACGTQLEEDDDNLLFKNEITTFDNPNDIITRHHQVEIQFYCQYAKRGNVSLGFSAHRESITVLEKGFGTFTYQFEFYQTSEFTSIVDPRNYPLDVVVKQMIYMDIEATTTVNTELFVESCRAAPYDNPNYHHTYPIIENGCSVIVCEAGNPNTRCAQGCMNSTSPQSADHHHRKRDAPMQSTRHHISQGPLRLIKTSESSVTNMNMVFMAGCFLASIAMVCGVILYKGKATGVKYQPLPTFET